MKARILGIVFVLVVLFLVYGFTQDDLTLSGQDRNPNTQVQSVPAPSTVDNDAKMLKIN